MNSQMNYIYDRISIYGFNAILVSRFVDNYILDKGQS